MQVRELEAYAQARGWTVSDRYSDERISGSQAKRPALDRILSACRGRQIDMVVVWRLDRLGRGLKHLTHLGLWPHPAHAPPPGAVA